MSVVVRMEMPKNCYECPFSVFDDTGIWCNAIMNQVYGCAERDEDCPILCQLPEEHGDLVDWNDLDKELEATFADYVDDVPYFDNGHAVFLRRKVYPDALMIRPIKAKIIIPEEGGK